MLRIVKLPVDESVQCTRCRKVLIDEEYNSHECFPQIDNYKIIKCAMHNIVTKPNGETIIDVWAFDGTNYIFEEVPENKEYTKMPYKLPTSTDFEHRDDQSSIEQNHQKQTKKAPIHNLLLLYRHHK